MRRKKEYRFYQQGEKDGNSQSNSFLSLSLSLLPFPRGMLVVEVWCECLDVGSCCLLCWWWYWPPPVVVVLLVVNADKLLLCLSKLLCCCCCRWKTCNSCALDTEYEAEEEEDDEAADATVDAAEEEGEDFRGATDEIDEIPPVFPPLTTTDAASWCCIEEEDVPLPDCLVFPQLLFTLLSNSDRCCWCWWCFCGCEDEEVICNCWLDLDSCPLEEEGTKSVSVRTELVRTTQH